MPGRCPDELTEWLAEPRERFAATLEEFEMSALDETEPNASVAQIRALAEQYTWAADWLRMRQQQEVINDHVDRFFADQVLGVLAEDFTQVSDALLIGR